MMENRAVRMSMRTLMANSAAISGQEASHWSFYIHFGKQPWQSDGERRIIRCPYHLSKRHNTVEKFRTRQLRRLAQKAMLTGELRERREHVQNPLFITSRPSWQNNVQTRDKQFGDSFAFSTKNRIVI